MLNCKIMSKMNPLAGLIANYGDSEDEGEEDLRAFKPETRSNGGAVTAPNYSNASGAIHPAPIPHCPWSACYDETSGYTYYWNQQTNAVTWEAPPEYLLALKLAQQQISASGSGEVSAEEWQLYQQALAEKQVTQAKAAIKSTVKPIKKNEPNISTTNKGKNNKFNNKKRPFSEEEEKIELITSYYNSDSDSNDEAEPPAKVKITQPPVPVKPSVTQPPIPKPQPKPNVHKKPKLKIVEYGPALPPNANYAVPIGPDLPPELINAVKSPDSKTDAVQETPVTEDAIKEDNTSKINDEDSQDETTLLMKLKDKTKILEKLGGEIPKELQQMISEEIGSGCATPITDDTSKSQTNIDDLLEEIEKKELPKISKANKVCDDRKDGKSNEGSPKNSPKRDETPPLELKPLFPSILNIKETLPAVEVESQEKKVDIANKKIDITEKKGVNLYLNDTSEHKETVTKKKLRISNSVLPKKAPEYTTKYSQFIEGFSSERVGLGFSKDSEDSVESAKNAISYGNGLVFTKGETLNEQKKEEDLDDLTELVEMKLKYLNQLQPCVLTPVQEMLVQMQTLGLAFRAGALSAAYYRRYAAAAGAQLAEHESRAAPPGWSCAFQRFLAISVEKSEDGALKGDGASVLVKHQLGYWSEGRYCYRRESDGLVQWEYPATTHTDMDISTTPPHPGIEDKEEVAPPPLPAESTRAGTPPPPPPPALGASAWRAPTPPPPAWADPPPPGCDDLPPLLPTVAAPKQAIGDELASFYNDIAQLEKVQSAPHTASNSPEPPVERQEKIKEQHVERERETKQMYIEKQAERPKEKEIDRQREKSKEKDVEKKRDKVSKKKSKVKISASVGLKHKSVSNLVAKWQQVAEEINSD